MSKKAKTNKILTSKKYLFIVAASFVIFTAITFCYLVRYILLTQHTNTIDPLQKTSSLLENTHVAVIYIATGNYITFWDNFYKSAEKISYQEQENITF